VPRPALPSCPCPTLKESTSTRACTGAPRALTPAAVVRLQGQTSEHQTFLERLQEKTRLPSGFAPGSDRQSSSSSEMQGVTPTRTPSAPLIALVQSDSHDDSHTSKTVKAKLEEVLGKGQVRAQASAPCFVLSHAQLTLHRACPLRGWLGQLHRHPCAARSGAAHHSERALPQRKRNTHHPTAA
jgi:hypothetical protein